MIEKAMKTFWLSFVDDTDTFLGVALVDVTQEMADDSKFMIDLMFPNHADGAEWSEAATREAHRAGCNPGGQVMTVECPSECPYPRKTLLSKADLQALGSDAKSLRELKAEEAEAAEPTP